MITLTVCSCCAEEVPENDTTQIPYDGSICSDCFDEHYIECDACGDTTMVSDSASLNYLESGKIHTHIVCDSCKSDPDNTLQCRNCNDYFPVSELQTLADDYLCAYCRPS